MTKIKAIALYLPQYHEIKENNEWWGQGFTEWTNVKKAKPLIPNHYQPHVPLNQNYYNLDTNETLQQQAKLAASYGIHAFCFYHYWFNGKLLLEKPIHNLLNSPEPNFPFCLCWANENWTRRWNGGDKDILMEQNYGEADDLKHIEYLIPIFKDPRYLKIDGKPVFIMYRTELHPDINAATALWRREVQQAGFPDLYLIRTESFKTNIDPQSIGFDAAMEFAPSGCFKGRKIWKKNLLKYLTHKFLHKTGIKKSPIIENGFFDYEQLVKNMMNRPMPKFKLHRCITPSWDNSARRKSKATIYLNSSPAQFETWTKFASQYTASNFEPETALMFVNAWNEWAEGCHLEPDEKYGYAYLEAFKKGIENYN
ncbi:MAG: glycosyl hydrolase [Pedobacter sp.]|nr:MAG: glycosyl hydrolase [Pedobacter sp.]